MGAIIYIAGNPDAYPMEYYDTETGSFEGMIPELMRRFSEETGYDVRYYAAGKQDRREELAQNCQVDVISGCLEAEAFRHVEGEEIFLLHTQGEETGFCRLLITEVAPESFVSDFCGFFAELSPETELEALVETSRQHPPVNRTGLRIAAASLGLTIVLLAAALVITVRKYRRRLQALERDKEADEITGIGNREYFERNYQQFVNDKNKVLYTLFYFYVDTERMDQMKGRAHTNDFLRRMASILQEYTADTDILARMTENSFVLLRLSVDGTDEKEWLSAAFLRIKGIANGGVQEDALRTAAGIYHLRSDDFDLDEMIFDAAQSAQSACQKGLDYIVCTDEVLQGLTEERRLQADVERGFENREFQLYIQYYVDARNGRILGGEGLSRWEHPQKGLLMPGTFVPLMEREHLISRLDYDSLDQVCSFLQELWQGGREDFFISCNFSKDTLAATDFLENCKTIISKYQFPRELLIFEITESAESGQGRLLYQNMKELKKLGVGIVLDDFGEGFASFVVMKDYPLDGMKLDKRLIESIGSRAGDSSLRAMIQVCHDLGITTLAEGVETEEQVEFLRREHCDVIQGFHVHRPVPEWEVRQKLRKNHGRDIYI